MKKFSKGNHNNNLYQHYSPQRNYQQQYHNNNHNNQQYRNHQCRNITYILFLSSSLLIYYFYLTSLYLIDLTLEGDTLREPNANEQTTIRVALSSQISTSLTLSASSLLSSPLPEIISLKKFVSHYSLCPCVKEIQIIWPYDSNPDPNDFTYAHTHSRVIFETNINKDLNIDTNSVTLLDIDVFVSCSDLAFTISVWRSASDSIVGYFPKLHSIDTNSNSINGIFGWQYVWWYESYSIISSSAAVIHKRYMNEVYKSSKYLEFIKSYPTCSSSTSILSLWINSLNMNDHKPPVWISDVKVKTNRNHNYNDNDCIAKVVNTIGIESKGMSSIPISSHHATQAKNYWLW